MHSILPVLLRYSTYKVIHAAARTHKEDKLFNVKII